MRQKVKPIDPFSERDEADHLVIDGSPDLAIREYTLPQGDAVLVGCVKPRQPRQTLIKCFPVNDGGLVYFILGQPP